MKCEHDHENTPKFVKDALMTLKTLERVSDTMMEADVDVELHAEAGIGKVINERAIPVHRLFDFGEDEGLDFFRSQGVI